MAVSILGVDAASWCYRSLGLLTTATRDHGQMSHCQVAMFPSILIDAVLLHLSFSIFFHLIEFGIGHYARLPLLRGRYAFQS